MRNNAGFSPPIGGPDVFLNFIPETGDNDDVHALDHRSNYIPIRTK